MLVERGERAREGKIERERGGGKKLKGGRKACGREGGRKEGMREGGRERGRHEGEREGGRH